MPAKILSGKVLCQVGPYYIAEKGDSDLPSAELETILKLGYFNRMIATYKGGNVINLPANQDFLTFEGVAETQEHLIEHLRRALGCESQDLISFYDLPAFAPLRYTLQIVEDDTFLEPDGERDFEYIGELLEKAVKNGSRAYREVMCTVVNYVGTKIGLPNAYNPLALSLYEIVQGEKRETLSQPEQTSPGNVRVPTNQGFPPKSSLPVGTDNRDTLELALDHTLKVLRQTPVGVKK